MDRAPWLIEADADDFAVEMDRPTGPIWKLAGVIAVAVVLVLFALLVRSAAGIVETVPSPCEIHEAREGSTYGKLAGGPIERFRTGTSLRFVERSFDTARYEPGTVVRVSTCDVPQGFDVIVYVAAPIT